MATKLKVVYTRRSIKVLYPKVSLPVRHRPTQGVGTSHSLWSDTLQEEEADHRLSLSLVYRGLLTGGHGASCVSCYYTWVKVHHADLVIYSTLCDPVGLSPFRR